jgi:hypothetical protein
LAQAEAPFAQRLSPRANTRDDQGNAAEPGQQLLPGRINPLGESQLLIARKQLIIANVSEVNVEWIPQAARIVRTRGRHGGCTILARRWANGRRFYACFSGNRILEPLRVSLVV